MNKRLLTSNLVTAWFDDGEQWFTSLNSQIKRIFQKSPSSPHRLMIRHIVMEDDNLIEIFKKYKRAKQIKICYVSLGNLLDPNSNEIIGEFRVSELKRHWLNFDKRADYYKDVYAPFFEFEGVYKPVDNQPFAPVFYGKATERKDE